MLLTAMTACEKKEGSAPAAQVTEVTAQTTTETAQAMRPPVLLYRTKDDGTAALQGYDMLSENVEKPRYQSVLRIPDEIDGLKVTAIDAEGFADADYFNLADFPDTLREMGSGCFRNSSVSSLTMHEYESLTFGDDAFSGCRALSNVWFNGSNAVFGDNAFAGCDGMHDVNFQDGSLTAGDNFCAGLKNLSVVLLQCEATLGNDYFSDCPSVQHIDISACGTLTLGDNCFTGCTGAETVLITGSALSFGSGCFAGCTTESVTIDKCTGEIGDDCFRDCKQLQYVLIQEGITKIGAGAFAGCSRVSSIDIPASVTEIGEGAFADCGDATILAPEGSYALQYAKEHGLDYDEME